MRELSNFLHLALFLGGGAVLLLGGCGEGGPTGVEQPPPERAFVGGEVCKGCHGTIYEEWQQTGHAKALATLEQIHQQGNSVCLRCHTTGFGEKSGFVSLTTTPNLANVQCEECHGAGSEHVANPSRESITLTLDAELCGTCHTGVHHPTVEEWRESKHAVALTTIQERPYGRDECLDCHSADRRLALNELPTLRSRAVAQFAVTCATCHDPHQATEHGHQLRSAVNQVCAPCHTAEEAEPGETPHHPQTEMLAGIGGFNADGTPLEGPNSPHPTAVEEGCVHCHLYQVEVEEPTEENPNRTGHTFMPDLKACAPCHDEVRAQQLKEQTQQSIQEKLAELAGYFTPGEDQYVDPQTLSAVDRDRYDLAKFNYLFVQNDASQGVHNRAYADALLNVARDIMTSL